MRTGSRQSGFTLIEVAIAISILAIITLGLMTTSRRTIRTVTDNRAATIAAAAADARIAVVRQWPTYSTLDSAYAVTESNVPLTGWTRTTTMVRTGGPTLTNDYKRVTVRVTGPGLPQPIIRNITLAAQ
jgi:prepilin-type N-terminal cleavage/methylation domain-containing protein